MFFRKNSLGKNTQPREQFMVAKNNVEGRVTNGWELMSEINLHAYELCCGRRPHVILQFRTKKKFHIETS